MYQRFTMSNPEHKRMFDEYLDVTLRNKKLADMGEHLEPKYLKRARDIEHYAQAHFSPQDLQLIQAQMQIAAPAVSRQIDNIVKDVVSKDQKAEIDRINDAQRRLEEYGNREMTKDIVSGGLSVKEYQELIKTGKTVRKAPSIRTPEEQDNINKHNTVRITKSGKGLSISEHINAFDSLELAQDEQEFQSKLNRHGLTDSKGLREMVDNWKHSGMEQALNARHSLADQDDEVIELHEDMERNIDVKRAWADSVRSEQEVKDFLEEPISGKYREGGTEMTQDLCAAMDAHTPKSEYATLMEELK